MYDRISVNSSNVQSLLDAANQYQIEPVKKMCVEFLKGQIDATNCLGRNTNAVKSQRAWNVKFFTQLNIKIISPMCFRSFLPVVYCNL